MKEQDEKLLLIRELGRSVLIMKRLNIKNQTYQKLMGQKVNGIYNRPLNDWEVKDLVLALTKVQEIVKKFIDELLS